MEEALVGAVVGTTIKVVLQHLISFPVEEIGLIWNFDKDLQKLKKAIVMNRDFLEDAETKQVTDKAVTRWLMKLEAVAFDVDYVFDELNYQLLRNKDKKKVSSFFSPSNPIAFRHKMARKIKNINKELRLINQEASSLGLQMRFAGAHAYEAPAYLETDSLISVDPVFVGRENDVAKVVEMVTNVPTEQVVFVLPIVGMGGLGKTTLTRKVYNDQNIISHFGERIWVHVGESFDPAIVLKKTLESLTEESVDGSREVVLRKLQKSLGGKRYLLVLDNFWDEENEKWENFIISLKGISHVKGNVIMVTTRKGNVASIVKNLDVHELGVLSQEECWSIIKAKVFGGKGIPSQFETVGRSMAKTCGGLPLAAQVLGSLLCGKSKDEWVSIEKNWLSSFGGDGKTVSKILKLSFDDLSSPSLKKCFAFCSIIPKGWWIEKDELIHLWMAERLLQTDQEKDMEMVGNTVFNILLQSSLLQVLKRDCYGNIISCGMHDLVHDLASSILNHTFLDGRFRYISRPFKDASSPIPKEQVKCLHALFFSGKISNIMFSNLKCLHVLILNDGEMKELPIEIGKLISLRYLDISHTRMECLPDSIGDLYHLQTLRATEEYGGRSYLRKLPNTFMFLVSLRHLYIPNIKLPPEMGKLIALQTLPYFQVGDEEGCSIMELGSLRNLKGAIEIYNLEKVRDIEEAKSAKLFDKQNIFKLKFVWNECGEGEANDEPVLEGLQPHSNLKSLEINGFKGKSFPLWTSRMAVREDLHWVRLDNLIELKLSNCNECQELPMLGHLLHLKSLYLHKLTNVRSIGSSFYGIEETMVHKHMVIVFPAIERLELIDMENLTAWKEVELSNSSATQPHEVSVFRRLEYLKISNCRQLKSAPSHFTCLKELLIDNMGSGLPLTNICGSKMTSLATLVIQRVDDLTCLPNKLFDNNRDLLELDIWNCSNLRHLVPWLGGGGASLKKLVIFNCPEFKCLPNDLYNLNALEVLTISSCPNLKSIPYLSCEELSSQGFTSLRHLELSYCSGLEDFPCQMLESCAHSLERLWLTGSKSLTNFQQVMRLLHRMSRLKDLGIKDVPNLTDAAEEIQPLCSLEELGIGGSSDCRDYVSFDRIFPALQSLRVLLLYGMEQWDALPEQLQHLTTLHGLCIVEFGVEVLPEWLERLSSLRILELLSCQKLRHLPSKKTMESLVSLSYLHVYQCPLLKQNSEQKPACGDSEWSKVSHVPYITVDGLRLSTHA